MGGPGEAGLTLIELLVVLTIVVVTAALRDFLTLLAREHRPTLVLLDLNLADLPGGEVLRRLQEDPRTRETAVVVISADATPGQIRRLLAAGARAYVTKPLDIQPCLRTLDEILAGADR